MTEVVGGKFNNTVIENVNGHTSYALLISANTNGGIGPTGLPVITSAIICKTITINEMFNVKFRLHIKEHVYLL